MQKTLFRLALAATATSAAAFFALPVQAQAPMPPSVPASTIVKSNTLADIPAVLTAAGPDTLVVFDIDDTLLSSNTFFGSDHWYEWQRGLKPGDAAYVPCKFDVIALNYEMGTQRPTEPGSVALVKALSNDLMYLTARSPAVRGATQRELRRADYPLPRAIDPAVDGLMFSLKDSSTGRVADVSYHSGVYMVSGLSKGDALVELLRRANKSYRHVVLVDDGERNIVAMQKALSGTGTAYTGFHYLHVTKPLPPYDELVQASQRSWAQLNSYLQQTFPQRAVDFAQERCGY